MILDNNFLFQFLCLPSSMGNIGIRAKLVAGWLYVYVCVHTYVQYTGSGFNENP